MKLVVTISILLTGFYATAQQADQFIRIGNDHYKKGEFDKAENEYNKVPDADTLSTRAKFNLGNALYKQNKKDEAIKQFDYAVSGNNVELKSSSFYNKGVVLTNEKKLEESIEAYKNALRQDPDDKDTRENLQKALLELKKKNPPKPKQDDKKKKPQNNQSSMSPKEAEQRLKLLEQKEKEVRQKMQSTKTGGSQKKDW